MSRLFDLDALAQRLRTFVERSERLKPEAARLLEEALVRGEFERGAAWLDHAQGAVVGDLDFREGMWSFRYDAAYKERHEFHHIEGFEDVDARRVL